MKKRLFIFTLLFLVFFISLNGRAIYASSASVAFSTSNKNPEVGDSIIVTLTVESSVGISDFQTYVAYDPSVLELVGTGSHVKGSDGLVLISDVGNEVDQLRQYRMKFKALREGSSEVYVSDTVYIYEATTGKEMSVSKNTIQVNVQKKSKSTEVSNKGLASLSISEGTLTPEFDSKTTEYETTVSADTDTLFIEAKGYLSAYEVNVQGNKNLKSGNNKATIRVTDQSGGEKVYTITIHKLTKKEEQENDAAKKQSESASFSVQKKGEKQYLKSSIKLQLVTLSSKEEIPAGYEESKIVLDGTKITAYIPKEDSKSNYVLLYGKVGKDSAGFYTFDRVGQTIQRYDESSDFASETQVDGQEGTQKQIVFLQRALLVCVIVILLLLFLLIRMKKKANARREYLKMEWEKNEESGKWDE